MLVIRTAEELAHALASPLDRTLRKRLEARRDALLEYENFAFDDLALFLIVQPSDRIEDMNQASPRRLVEGRSFLIEPETAARHGCWLELVFILSDDGFGLVLFVPTTKKVDHVLRAACEAHLADD